RHGIDGRRLIPGIPLHFRHGATPVLALLSRYGRPAGFNVRSSAMTIPRVLRCLLVLALLSPAFGSAAATTDTNALSLKRIFDSAEFNGDSFSARWLEDGSGYVTFENSRDTTGGRDLVRHDPKTGAKTILVPASDFIPPDESAPLRIEGYTWFKDR